MTFSNDVIESMPIGVELSTVNIALSFAMGHGIEVHPWDRRTLITRVHDALVKGVRDNRIERTGMVRADNGREVATWTRTNRVAGTRR